MHRLWKTFNRTNLPVFKGDLPDQRHALVLRPGVRQVKVGERAEVDQVGNAFAHRFVDYIVSAKALRLWHGPEENRGRE